MKPFHFLVFLGAAAALSSCNSKQENAASNEPLKITPIAPPKGGDWALEEIVGAAMVAAPERAFHHRVGRLRLPGGGRTVRAGLPEHAATIERRRGIVDGRRRLRAA